MSTQEELKQEEEGGEAPEPAAAAPPIQSRFLFVDVAAQRAKQLRRGALPRLGTGGDGIHHLPRKLERVAMEEVRRGLISYELPRIGSDRNEGS